MCKRWWIRSSLALRASLPDPVGSNPVGLYPVGLYPVGLYPVGLYPVGLYPAGPYWQRAVPMYTWTPRLLGTIELK
jgi:hypothetical protein